MIQEPYTNLAHGYSEPVICSIKTRANGNTPHSSTVRTLEGTADAHPASPLVVAELIFRPNCMDEGRNRCHSIPSHCLNLLLQVAGLESVVVVVVAVPFLHPEHMPEAQRHCSYY